MLKEISKKCPECFKTFVCSCYNKNKKFCSRKCANVAFSKNFKHSDETKLKMSKNKKGIIPWNKGITAKEDDRILSGENNAAYGKIYNTKKTNPQWAENISKSTKGKVNLGDKNGMKQTDAKNKVSEARKKMFRDSPQLKKQMSKKKKKEWADGKYEGVKVGQCKWYKHIKSDGTIINIQGTWERAFVEWADKNNLNYVAHKGRISYTINGITKLYYPDFFVSEWNSWVDIKNDYHYNLQKEKFDALLKEGNNVKILRKDDLLKLGVNITNNMET